MKPQPLQRPVWISLGFTSRWYRLIYVPCILCVQRVASLLLALSEYLRGQVTRQILINDNKLLKMFQSSSFTNFIVKIISND